MRCLDFLKHRCKRRHKLFGFGASLAIEPLTETALMVIRLNSKFRELMFDDPFDFYYGPFANIKRTKYRNVDMPLTRNGVRKIHNSGIHVLVHGHRNLLHGQRLMLRKGLLNVECDATLNRNSRKRDGLKGAGAAVTIIRPEGCILGISSDYPYIKVFDPVLSVA